jgi:hypothetical protein
MNRSLCVVMAVLLNISWLGAQEAPEPPPPRAEVVVPAPDETAAVAPEIAEAGEAPAQPLVPETRGKDGLPDDPSLPVRVRIISPRPREIIPTSVVDVFLEVDNYTLTEGGNRLHVILDNGAPMPWSDVRRPFPLKNLNEGGHTVRVLAVRPDGVSLRGGEAFAMVHFYVKRKDFQNYTDPQAPFLTVNLPAEGAADLDSQGRLVFDYWVHNTDFANSGLRLKYQLDAYEGELAEDGPVLWSNLPPGKHKLVVELFDKTGQPVFGPFNRVEREFTVRQVLRAVPVEPEGENAASHPELGY